MFKKKKILLVYKGILEKIIHVQDAKQIVKYVRIKNIARYVQEVFIISLVLVSKNVEMEKNLSYSVMMEIKIMMMVVLQIVKYNKVGIVQVELHKNLINAC